MQGAIRLAVVALTGAAVSMLFFINTEKKLQERALVPLEMFKSPNFSGAITATAGMTFGMYSLLFLLPQTLQTTGRLGPIGIGIALVPMALVFVLISPFTGWIDEKGGTRFATSSGLAIIGCGLVLISMSTNFASLFATEVGLAMTGLGMGFATGALMGAAVGSIAAARSGTAAALINVARIVGAAIGVAVLGSVFSINAGCPGGLRIATAVGACVQMACAAVAWTAIQPVPEE